MPRGVRRDRAAFDDRRNGGLGPDVFVNNLMDGRVVPPHLRHVLKPADRIVGIADALAAGEKAFSSSRSSHSRIWRPVTAPVLSRLPVLHKELVMGRELAVDVARVPPLQAPRDGWTDRQPEAHRAHASDEVAPVRATLLAADRPLEDVEHWRYSAAGPGPPPLMRDELSMSFR